jgi:hypothetical protein
VDRDDTDIEDFEEVDVAKCMDKMAVMVWVGVMASVAANKQAF